MAEIAFVQGCTNLGRLVTRVTKFCAVALDINSSHGLDQKVLDNRGSRITSELWVVSVALA